MTTQTAMKRPKTNPNHPGSIPPARHQEWVRRQAAGSCEQTWDSRYLMPESLKNHDTWGAQVCRVGTRKCTTYQVLSIFTKLYTWYRHKGFFQQLWCKLNQLYFMVDIFMYIHVCRSLAFQCIDILQYPLSIYCSTVGIFQLPKTVLTKYERKLVRVSSHILTWLQTFGWHIYPLLIGYWSY